MVDKDKSGVKCRSVLNPGIARNLLKMGNPIYDIKPKRENPEATNFLFEVTEKFQSDLDNILTNCPYLIEKDQNINLNTQI